MLHPSVMSFQHRETFFWICIIYFPFYSSFANLWAVNVAFRKFAMNLKNCITSLATAASLTYKWICATFYCTYVYMWLLVFNPHSLKRLKFIKRLLPTFAQSHHAATNHKSAKETPKPNAKTAYSASSLSSIRNKKMQHVAH